MAGGARDIKRKIKSVNSTMQITNAMKLVSSAKLKRATTRMDITRPYFETVIEAVQDILNEDKSIKNNFVNDREIKKILYIVVTSDKGLCGGYNINILKKATQDSKDDQEASFVAIGRKAEAYLRKRDYNVVKDYLYISEKPEYSDSVAIAKEALAMYKSGEVDSIVLAYTRFVSTISQEPALLTLLPIVRSEKEEIEKNEDEEYQFVTYEPSPEEVLEFIIPKYVESTIFGGLIESAAAEQAARRTAMENATDNAEDIIDELSLSYNQARQGAITNEIIEIVSGAEALK